MPAPDGPPRQFPQECRRGTIAAEPTALGGVCHARVAPVASPTQAGGGFVPRNAGH